jgi:hypothetical protein
LSLRCIVNRIIFQKHAAGVKTELVVIPGGNHSVAGGPVAKRPTEFVQQYLLSP